MRAIGRSRAIAIGERRSRSGEAKRRYHRHLEYRRTRRREPDRRITDLHRHFIDDLTFEENGKVYRRIPEVFDCWFESGSMPYAQDHFPFET